MALRLQGGGYSTFDNVGWDVYIYGPGSGTINAHLGPNIFTKRYEGAEDVNAAIIPSSVSITLLAKDQSESDAHEALLSEIALGNEGDFILKIAKNGVLDWVGIILADQIKFSEDRLPRPFTIRAVDGLARLKEIEFNKDGTEFDTVPAYLSQHLIIGLQKTGLWAELSPGLKAVLSWTCAENTLYSTFLEGIRLNHIVWLYIDGKGANDTTTNKRSKKAWDVLEQIAQAFHARILMAEGSFWFIQIPALLNAATASIYTFGDNGAVSATTNGLPILYASSIDQLMGADREFQAAAKRAKVTYKHSSAKNLAISLNFVSGPVEVKAVESFSGTAKIFISFLLSYPTELNPTTYPTYLSHAHRFKLTLKVGNYYLKRTAQVNLGQIIYSDPVWTTTASDYEFYVYPNFGPNGKNRYQFNLVTPPLPANGDATINLYYVHTFFIGGSGTPIISGFEWFVNNGNFQVMPSGLIDEAYNETVYTQESSITATKQIEVVTNFGDGPFAHTLTTMKARRPEGTEPPITQNWTGSGLTGTVHQVLTASLIKLTGKPAKKLNRPFIGDFSPIGLLESESDFFLMLSGDYNARTHAWNGVFVQISDQPNGVTLPPVKYQGQIPGRGAVNTLPPVSSLPDPVIPDDGFFDPPLVKKADITAIRTGTIPVITTAPIEAGTVSSIQVEAFTLDKVLLTGDKIIVTDVKTGKPTVFTVSADTTVGGTTVSVTPITITDRIVDTSYLQLDPEYLYTRGITSLANIGTGAQVYKNTASGVANLRSILAGSGITVSQNANDITISAVGGGGSMTSFQIGADGGTINAITDGETLVFIGGTGITTQVATNQITINLSISELTTIGLASSDLIAFYDSSGLVHGKATIQDILNLVPAGFTSFNISGETGTANAITNGETFAIIGGAGIATTVSTNQITVILDFFNSLSVVTPTTSDIVAIYDVSGAAHGRITIQDIINLVPAGFSSFTISAGAGTPNTITNGETFSIIGGTAVGTSVSTNAVTVNFNLMALGITTSPTSDDFIVLYDNALGQHVRSTIANVLALGGGFTSFNIAGDSGAANAITNGETLTISGGVGLSSQAVTNGVVVNMDIASLGLISSIDDFDRIALYDDSSGGHASSYMVGLVTYLGIFSSILTATSNGSGQITLTHSIGLSNFNSHKIVASIASANPAVAAVRLVSNSLNSCVFELRNWTGGLAVSETVTIHCIIYTRT